METPLLPDGDDATIPDSATLWRRIFPGWWVLDQNTGQRRLSSAAFENYPNTNTMSVGIADEMDGPEVLLKGYDGYGIAAFTAGHARRQCRQAVARAPEPDQPWHAHVIGDKKKRSVRKCLLDGHTVVVEPRPNE